LFIMGSGAWQSRTAHNGNAKPPPLEGITQPLLFRYSALFTNGHKPHRKRTPSALKSDDIFLIINNLALWHFFG
jgi:hypothetical protein